MGWSKVSSDHRKPLMWWFHKVLCELGWALGSTKRYEYHLDKMVKLGYNLYGNKF